MSVDVLEILDPGLGASIQDTGRRGWRRFGVPPSGAMDDHAASCANRLLDNSPDAPVLEFLLQGACLRVLTETWLAITGAEAGCNMQPWRALRVEPGHVIEFPHTRFGVWIYLAVSGGFDAPRILGSASVYARGKIGAPCLRGEILRSIPPARPFALPAGVSGRLADWHDRRDYEHAPPLRVWPGPQWNDFPSAERDAFFATPWTVSSRSDRVGYRLEGHSLSATKRQIVSEPVLAGSIQIPEGGQPIVTMRDGPTVGGYPKLGLIDAADLSWLAQCRPGTKVRFQPVA